MKKTLPIFFIIGRPRSGTSLLRMLFDAHPNVRLPMECPFLLFLFNKYNQITFWEKNLLEQLANDLFTVKKSSLLLIEKDSFMQGLLKFTGNFSFEEIARYVYLSTNSVFPKEDIQIIGDKTPAYSMEMSTLMKLFPDLKMIYIVRDYRDHIVSMKKAGFFKKSIIPIAFLWKKSFQQFLYLKNKHPENFYLLQYEKFVSNPELYLKEMCQFLSISYFPEAFNYYKYKDKFIEILPNRLQNPILKSLFQPIKTDLSGKWKSEMKNKEVMKAESVVGKYAEIAGYKRKYILTSGFYKLLLLPQILFLRYSIYTMNRFKEISKNKEGMKDDFTNSTTNNNNQYE